MPCYTEPPTELELAIRKIRPLLVGTGIRWRSETSDKNFQRMAVALCAWCKRKRLGKTRWPLERQIWWRDHQRADARHERARTAAVTKKRLVASARKKLTAAELRALAGR